MLNRSAITVRAKQPFLDWLRQLPDPVDKNMTLDRANEESHIYLLPEYDMMEEQEGLLRGCFEYLFESQLEGWWNRESDWPPDRDFELFNTWFDVEFHSVIEDLVRGPLIDD